MDSIIFGLTNSSDAKPILVDSQGRIINGDALTPGDIQDAITGALDGRLPNSLGSQTPGNGLAVSTATKVSLSGLTYTGIINNNILDASGSGNPIDVRAYNSCELILESLNNTSGVFNFEGAYDAAFTIGVRNIPLADLAGFVTTITSNFSTSAIGRRFFANLQGINYLRLRTTATTGVTVVAHIVLNQSPPTPSIFNTVIGSSVALTTVGNIAASGSLSNVLSGTITASANSSAFSSTTGTSHVFVVDVSSVSGVLPTYDVVIQESFDTGVSWQVIYTFPTITAAGIYQSPLLNYSGNRFRVVQILGGTSPSFTRIVRRLASNNVVLPTLDRDLPAIASKLPVLINNEIPVINNQFVNASASSASISTSPITPIDINNYTLISCQVLGTFVATIQFQGSNNNSNWLDTSVIDSSTGSAIASVTAPGIYLIPKRFRYLRAENSAYTSGTITTHLYCTNRG